MKRVVYLFLFISSQIFGQIEIPASFKAGFKDGASTSQISGDFHRGFKKFGYVGGAYLKARIKNEWILDIEALYMQCGSRHNADHKNGKFNHYFLQLNYIEVPVLLQYYIEDFCIELGPGFGFLMKTKEITYLNGVDVDGTRAFNSTDINFNIGVSYILQSNFGFNLRYTNSILPTRKNLIKGSKIVNYGQLNSILTLSLVYEFELRKKFRD